MGSVNKNDDQGNIPPNREFEESPPATDPGIEDSHPQAPVETDEGNKDIPVSGEADSQELNGDSEKENNTPNQESSILQSPIKSPNSKVIENCEQEPGAGNNSPDPVEAAQFSDEEVEKNDAKSSGNESDWNTRSNQDRLSSSDSEDEQRLLDNLTKSRRVRRRTRHPDSDYSVEVKRYSRRKSYYRGYHSDSEGRVLQWFVAPGSEEGDSPRLPRSEREHYRGYHSDSEGRGLQWLVAPGTEEGDSPRLPRSEREHYRGYHSDSEGRGLQWLVAPGSEEGDSPRLPRSERDHYRGYRSDSEGRGLQWLVAPGSEEGDSPRLPRSEREHYTGYNSDSEGRGLQWLVAPGSEEGDSPGLPRSEREHYRGYHSDSEGRGLQWLVAPGSEEGDSPGLPRSEREHYRGYHSDSEGRGLQWLVAPGSEEGDSPGLPRSEREHYRGYHSDSEGRGLQWLVAPGSEEGDSPGLPRSEREHYRGYHSDSEGRVLQWLVAPGTEEGDSPRLPRSEREHYRGYHSDSEGRGLQWLVAPGSEEGDSPRLPRSEREHYRGYHSDSEGRVLQWLVAPGSEEGDSPRLPRSEREQEAEAQRGEFENLNHEYQYSESDDDEVARNRNVFYRGQNYAHQANQVRLPESESDSYDREQGYGHQLNRESTSDIDDRYGIPGASSRARLTESESDSYDRQQGYGHQPNRESESDSDDLFGASSSSQSSSSERQSSDEKSVRASDSTSDDSEYRVDPTTGWHSRRRESTFEDSEDQQPETLEDSEDEQEDSEDKQLEPVDNSEHEQQPTSSNKRDNSQNQQPKKRKSSARRDSNNSKKQLLDGETRSSPSSSRGSRTPVPHDTSESEDYEANKDNFPLKRKLSHDSLESKKLKKPSLPSEEEQSEEEREDTESEDSEEDQESDSSKKDKDTDSDSESEGGGPAASNSEEPAQDQYTERGGADQNPAPEGGADQNPAPEGGADQNPAPEGGANQDPAPESYDQDPAPENYDQDLAPENYDQDLAPENYDQDPAPENYDQDPAPENYDQDPAPENYDQDPAPENYDQICASESEDEGDDLLFFSGKGKLLKSVPNPLGDDLNDFDVSILLYMTFSAYKLDKKQLQKRLQPEQQQRQKQLQEQRQLNNFLFEQQKLFVQEKVRQQQEQHRWQQDQVQRERKFRQQEEQKRLEYERNLEKQKEDHNRQLRLQREQYLINFKQLERLRQGPQQENRPNNTQPQRKRELMQNDMVSIPVANLNGGLKAASSGSGVAVVAAGGVVSSAVLANAPRVYLTPSSTFMANRQMAGVATTGKISGPVVGGSSGTTSAAGTVRYFSQFSKVQTAGGPGLQRKLTNGDTIVLANGNKSMFLTSSNDNKGVMPTVATNGNGLLTAKTELLEEEGMQPVTVIDDDEDEDEDDGESSNNAKSIGDQQPENQPLALANAANDGNASDDEPELDIVINNVVCSFSVGCHLKLRDIALQGSNVEYRRENGMVTMKLRHPYTTASIWSSGRITCTGATSEAMAKVAARRYARCLGKLGFPTRFLNFRIVNVLGTCSMPWAIKIVNFSERHRENASYEPELHPGVTYKMRDPDPKATLKIFSTGSVTVTAASVNHVESAIQHIYPRVFDFRKQRSAEELQHLRQKQRLQGGVDPNEMEKHVLADNKTASQDNIFVNTTAAHSKSSSNDQTSASAGILSSTVDSMPRLKQMVNYHQIMKHTQDERRHIPLHGEKVNSASTSSAAAAPSTSSSSSSGDNICANARRRATECWATKLQNKRPRYNDPGTTGTVNASSSSATSASAATSSFASQATHLRNPLKTAALANARMRGAKVPTRIASNSLILHQQQLVHMQQQQQQKLRQTSFSPSEFNVDDLIEEEESNELDMHF
ncbi:trichohyalin [Drosophila santomea]|nr:trichohyalin [Drosophila santomea]XP_039498524.1 trichohyalin [Drosophila santomea]